MHLPKQAQCGDPAVAVDVVETAAPPVAR